MTDPRYWDHWFPDAFQISHEGVKAFARAVRSPHVPFESARTLPTDCPVPSTLLAAPMLQTCAAIVSDAVPGCNLSKIMHAGQTFGYHRSLRIGDVVSFGARLTSHLVRADTDLLTIEMGAFVGGDLAMTGTTLIVHARGDVGIDIEAMDSASNRIMMAGTGPAESDAYSDVFRT